MIKVICVGKLKESYISMFVNDYCKRINKYHKLEIIELKDSNIKDESIDILKDDAIKPINANTGNIDITIKNASCPGSIFICGLFMILNIFFSLFFICFFIVHLPYKYYNILF